MAESFASRFSKEIEKLKDPDFFRGGKASGRLAIITHHNADVDAVGTAIAFCELVEKSLGQEAPHILCPDGASIEGVRIAESLGIKLHSHLSESESYCGTVIVDSLEPEQLSPFLLDELPKPILLVMDHHYEKEGGFKEKALIYISAPLPSCAEVFYNTAKAIGNKWTQLSVLTKTALVSAIIVDSQGLRNATPETFLTLHELLSSPGDEEIYGHARDIIAVPHEDCERIATLKAFGTLKYERIKAVSKDGREILIAWCRAGNFEAHVAGMLIRTGADIGIVVCEKKDLVRLSARANKRVEKFIHLGRDVMEVLGRELNGSGGGHAAAASANLHGVEEDVAMEKCVTLIRGIIESFRIG